MRQTMRYSIVAGVLISGSSIARAEADPFKTDRQRTLAHALVEARVLSSLCGVTTLDQEFAASKLAVMVREGITVRQMGSYIEAESGRVLVASKSLPEGAACERGLQKFGPHGSEIPGLLQ